MIAVIAYTSSSSGGVFNPPGKDLQPRGRDSPVDVTGVIGLLRAGGKVAVFRHTGQERSADCYCYREVVAGFRLIAAGPWPITGVLL